MPLNWWFDLIKGFWSKTNENFQKFDTEKKRNTCLKKVKKN